MRRQSIAALLALMVAAACGGGIAPKGAGVPDASGTGCTNAHGHCLATGVVCMGQNVGTQDCGRYAFCCMPGGH